jgi:hypothetical protein
MFSALTHQHQFIPLFDIHRVLNKLANKQQAKLNWQKKNGRVNNPLHLQYPKAIISGWQQLLPLLRLKKTLSGEIDFLIRAKTKYVGRWPLATSPSSAQCILYSHSNLYSTLLSTSLSMFIVGECKSKPENFIIKFKFIVKFGIKASSCSGIQIKICFIYVFVED